MAPSGTDGVINRPARPSRDGVDSPAAGGGRIPPGVKAMSLDRDAQQAVIDWYNLYVKACPLCSSSEFMIEAAAIMQTFDLNLKLPVEGQGVPVVPIVCKNCGYVVLVSAIALKFLPPSTPLSKIE